MLYTFSLVEQMFKRSTVLWNYEQKSIFEVFVHVSKYLFGNNEKGLINVCLELRNSFWKFCRIPNLPRNTRERSCRVSNVEPLQATKLVNSFQSSCWKPSACNIVWLNTHVAEEPHPVESSCQKDNVPASEKANTVKSFRMFSQEQC